MNFLAKYNQIIESRPTRLKIPNDGYEKHHILPTSMGGKDTENNLVILTPREHYICHLLLSKFTKGKDRIKMVNAVRRMAGRCSKSYEAFRKGWMKVVSKQSLDRWADSEFKNKMKLIHKNRNHNRIKEMNMARWSKPEASNEFKQWWKKNRKKMANSHQKAWLDPVKRKNRLDAIRKAARDPKLAQLRSERTKKGWETRRLRQSVS
jgi:hypothetical protein